MPRLSGKPAIIKQVNRDIIIHAVSNTPGITKPQIATATNLTLTTVNKIVSELVNEGQLFSMGQEKVGTGRPAQKYYINADYSSFLNVYVSTGVYHCSVTNLAGDIIKKSTFQHRAQSNRNTELISLLGKMIQTCEKSLRAISIAVPGTVKDGLVLNIPAIPEWEGFQLRDYLLKHFHYPVIIENDINAATISIYNTCKTASINNMVLLFLDKYMGAGIVINGNLYKSQNFFSGEVGFMSIPGYPNPEAAFRQALLNNDYKVLIDITVILITNICCVLDPDLFVLSCPAFHNSNLATIRNAICQNIPAQFVPQFMLRALDVSHFINGLHLITVQKTQLTVRLI